MSDLAESSPQESYRLGFSIRVFGSPNLPSYDARGPGEASHLSVNLAFLRDICLYLQANRIAMYRMHSSVIPAGMHADPDALAGQIDECRAQLEQLSQLIQRSQIRLSFHPYSQVTLNALNEEQADRSLRCLASQVLLLDALGLGPEAVVVLHAGGVYDNLQASAERFVRRYEALPEVVRRRVVLEQDDSRYGHAAVRAIQEACGVPLVFDGLHHRVWNPEHVPVREALAYSLRTWPDAVRPKVHFATARSEMRLLEGSRRIKTPTWTEHADFVVPFEFIEWMELAAGLRPFDIMLEAKARDVALLQLRRDLLRFAPDLAARIA
ncbi:MAG: UV DNA damage repair endonuclease UvsE [Anaerolineae bacterium]